MKLNKSKNKGKVHPSPSSSSPDDTVSTLNNLLPTAILTLISILSLQDKEVLAYMITHSLSSSTSPSLTTNNHTGKKPTSKNGGCKKAAAAAATNGHKIPTFDCGCFECYTTYWFRWDSSPNRELIHQAIEAFEEHPSASAASPPPPVLVLKTDEHEEPSPEEVAGGGVQEVKKQAQLQQHKGLARKVLPDVIGLFNSRLWNLWGPNL